MSIGTGRLCRIACLAFVAMLVAGPSSAAEHRPGGYLGIRAIGSAAQMKNLQTIGFTGTPLIQHKEDLVAGPAIVGGWVFHNFPLRVEVEVGHRVRFDLDVRDIGTPVGIVDYEVDVATWEVLINALLEWRNTSSFTPFGGIVFGWTLNEASTQRSVLSAATLVNQTKTDYNIAYGGVLGLNWQFSDNWSTDVMYRLINLGSVTTPRFPGGDQITADEYFSQDVLWSFYYHF